MTLVLEILGAVICVLFLYQISRGAIFLPSQKQTVAKIIRLANIQPGVRLADLGAGDGRIVIAAAEAGAHVVGFEFNPLLAFWARLRIRSRKLEHAQIKIADFWHQDLSQFDVIVLFGIDYIMEKLEQKLRSELKSGSLVISNAFEFPHWQKIKSEQGVIVYQK